MRRFVTMTLALLLLGPALWALAQSKDKSKSEKTSAAAKSAYQAILDNYQKADEEYAKALKNAQTPEEKQAAQGLRPNLGVYTNDLLALAKKYPKDPIAEKSLGWIVEKNSASPQTPGAKEAADLLVKNYAKSAELGPACPILAHYPGADKKLRQIAEKNPHKEVRGQAFLALAEMLRKQSLEVTPNKEKAAKEAENLLNLAIDKYADVETPQGTLGDRAKEALADLQQFGYGKLAPDIEGEDADGKTFKLSDYLGKVVLLDFWGGW